ncbi:MAG: ammonium transporter [Bifidobacterium tibiigranuli]|uniref:ammonium transporter n=1 Tax=Bifidobacterium tibiigranuli TaxID=2172043 RepID=UPI002355D3B8|nr:ammonium transporter [Bifidobacterium tibiigranuli]MCH3975352.1 ammonium transporter [Bifidobacterium tibiigranuli]MCH4189931.1 ammonium transporter [Bifidobacterium tibiigranuli]MCH4203551.1 ammonium transporter [Bifidobacterium tibiigranuli]MCH4273837.1 ammonium transporter [Bifidobacterium tibiigranuli]MCI1791077.1 ammonium transporter [Bifidobacterium tibiigranuli]
MDSGNAAWMLTSASFVLLMTPAVAFFYGGMVRAKAVLNMLMLSAGALAVTAIVWTFWGWSIAYAGKDIGGIFGDPATGFLLKDSMVSDHGVFTAATNNANHYPVSIDVAFQTTFAMITVALISGALAERIKYSTWMIFVALWITFDYAPMAHMVWNGGLLSPTGAISQAIGASAHDFAGGTVVHINAAVAALVIVLIIGKRKGFGKQPIKPHNVPFVMLGAFLLWFGWFGFNAGSAFGANGTAGYAWVSTTAATAAAMLSWGFTERIRTGHYTALGAASGMVAGLVAITPAADVVSPLWAMVLGAIAGVLTCLACNLKFMLGYDDSLDVVGVHGVGGVTGTVLIGFFGSGTGLFAGGNWRQLVVQICIAAIAILFSGVMTAVIAFALEKTVGWRVTEAQEVAGVDLSDQGETAYDFAGTASSILKEVK